MQTSIDLEEMRIQQDDKDWISNQIKDALGNYESPAKPQENIVKRNSYWLTPTIIVGTVLALLGGALDNRIDSRLDLKLTSINGSMNETAKELTAIRERLARVETKVDIETLRKIAKATPSDFTNSLGELRAAVQAPHNARPEPQVVKEIAVKLTKTPETSPEYWPTVLRFVQFASSKNESNAPAPGPAEIVIREGVGLIAGPDGHVHNRRVLMESGAIVDTVFENSRITFTNNPVVMQGVVFVNCVFEMPDIEMPSPYLKKAASVLIASDLSKIVIPKL